MNWKRGRRGADFDGTPGEGLPNTAIIEAMANLAVSDTSERRAVLFQLLLETTLIVATPYPQATSRAYTAVAGDSFDLVSLSDGDGTTLPVFTSIEALRRWLPEVGGYVGLPSSALFEMAALSGTNKIAIDLASPTTGYLTRDEIEQLARGRLPLGRAGDVVANASQVRIGQPKTPPAPEALNAIRAQLAAQPEAERAWYFLMQQGGQPPEMVIAVKFDERSGPDTASDILRVIVDGSGRQCEAVRALAFVVADGHWQASLSDGSGEQFFGPDTTPS